MWSGTYFKDGRIGLCWKIPQNCEAHFHCVYPPGYCRSVENVWASKWGKCSRDRARIVQRTFSWNAVFETLSSHSRRCCCTWVQGYASEPQGTKPDSILWLSVSLSVVSVILRRGRIYMHKADHHPATGCLKANFAEEARSSTRQSQEHTFATLFCSKRRVPTVIVPTITAQSGQVVHIEQQKYHTPAQGEVCLATCSSKCRTHPPKSEHRRADQKWGGLQG